MPRKRMKIFETRRFAFLIGAAIVGLLLLVDGTRDVLRNVELKILDTHFILKNERKNVVFQEGTVKSINDPKRSEDIVIIGVDQNSLSKFGRWPFPRWRHADLINAFSRIKDRNSRERAVFLDIFFADPGVAADDSILLRGMEESGRVFLENVMKSPPPTPSMEADVAARQDALAKRWGLITDVKGDWKSVEAFLGAEAPLVPYANRVKGYGHANYIPDADEIYRRQPLVIKQAVLVEIIKLDELKPGYAVDENAFERLAWLDKEGRYHNIDTPVSEKALVALKAVMEKNAPFKIEDVDSDGTPDLQYHIIRKFRDSFVPAITLSLALEYLGKKVQDVEVTLGEHIRIAAPMKFDPETGEWKPYQIVVVPEEYDEDGNITKPGVYRTLKEIVIPIDRNGRMLVNYLGAPSEEAFDGRQTFPMRSYSGYASKAPSPDASTWPRSMNLANKILMVGAFARGMAQDEKPTPFGLMYGIEIHSNALNTILMDNFLRYVPYWQDVLVLVLLVAFVCFYSSRLSTVWSFFITIGILIVVFFVITFTFEQRNLIFNFTKPAFGILICFVAVVVYRAFTEERDKRAIRDIFGKYVSPRVVDQLVDNPPELGGVDKQLTVFFSDIRGFTTLSENMSPQELVNHLNEYLTAMTDLVLDYGGTLDKYIGDAVMCFWGAPLPQADHAVLSCKCALRQMKRLAELNLTWPEAIRINIGIGINSGIMTVGNMGSPIRMNYTLTGDNVNLGSRLEATNKEYTTNIIISESTYGLVKDKFMVRELDNIRVKGKNKPVVIYELIDCLENIDPPLKGSSA
ncbi:MAG: adenylate/guanylate cyclase domain-containing protein [Spirochaetes bacterium]|nr:adenylate/guanylate cyclase domain-containing protein [Spirochaetota bacterium]